MLNLEYKIRYLGSKKGEIVTLLTLGLVVIGAVITIGSSFFVNKTKIASNPRASSITCPYSCQKYDCSYGYIYKAGYSCSGFDYQCCQKNSFAPTTAPTSPSNGCYYPNSRECQNDCNGSCTWCVGGRYKCVARVIIPTPTKTRSSCSSVGVSGSCSTLTCCQGLTKVTGAYGYCQCSSTRACTPGSIQCNGQYKETCKDDGSGWSRKYCSYGCTNNECKSQSVTIPTPTHITKGSCPYTNFSEAKSDCDPYGSTQSGCAGGTWKCLTSISYPNPTSTPVSEICPYASARMAESPCGGRYIICTNGKYRCGGNGVGIGKLCPYTQQMAQTACSGNYLPCSDGSYKCAPKITPTSTAVVTLSTTCTSLTVGTCCGSNSICKMTRFGPTCQSCSGNLSCQPGKGCFDDTGCTNNGGTNIINNKCFACYFYTNQSKGKLIEVAMSICDDIKSGKLQAVDNVTVQYNAVSTEDQYTLRQNAFDRFEKSDATFGDKSAAWLMEQADSLTYYTFGQLPRIFGGKADSSMGNYYVAQTEANAAAATEGKIRKVGVGQALTTGVIGGYQYANGMLFGIPDATLNLVTGGKTKNWEENTLTNLYGADESAAALKTITAGSDLTNVVALLVPVGKGLSAAGSKMTTTATRLEQAGQAGVRSVLLKGGGKVVSVAGEGFQIISPETWAAGFIKSAPVTTFLEETSASVSRLRPVVAASTKVTEVAGSMTGKIATTFPKTFKVVSTVGKTTINLGKKVVDIFLPQSALSYTPEEAARYLARDINIGIIQPEDSAARLLARYKQSFVNSSQITNFADKLGSTGLGEDVTTQVKNHLLIDLQEQLAKRAQTTTFGDRLISLIKQQPEGEVKVIGDLHSDVSTSKKMLSDLGFIDPKTGKAKDIFGVIEGDYFGKPSSTLVEESTTPGYDILKSAVDLQEQTGGKIVALDGNWEARTAYATRLQKLNQLANEAINRGDEVFSQTLLKDNGYSSIQALDDEISAFLKLNKPITGRMPMSHEEISFLATNNEELGSLLSKLKVMTRAPDGSVFQHVDTAESLRYVFNSAEEIEALAITPESKTALKEIVSSRGNSQTYLNADQVRELNLAFKQLGWGGDQVMEKINQNTSGILEDGLTKLNSPLAKSNLLALEKDMGKSLAFYQTPDVLVEFANIFGQSGSGDLRLVTGHSPIDTISALLGKNPQSGFVELADGVYTLADNPNISIYGADRNISRGTRVRGPNNAFLEVVNGIIKIGEDTVLSPMLSGPIRIVTNPYDPAYSYYKSVETALTYYFSKGKYDGQN